MNDRLDERQFTLLAVAVAATLLTHLAHLPAWLWASVAVLLPLRAWLRQRGVPRVPAWVRLPLAGLLFVLVLTGFGNVFGREPGSVLGCGLLALKLLETERVRDARVALGFAAFVLMSALLFQQTLPFTLLVCAILLLVIAALAALQPAPLPTRHPLRAPFTTAALLLGAGLPLTAAAFVLVPRLGTPLWGAPGQDTLARTGLGERMTPGSLSELLIDDSPAFRVDFDGAPPPPAQRYFRAIVLWEFDGATWTRGFGPRQPEALQPQAAPSTYTITLEPTDRPWLPALDVPLAAPDGTRLLADRTIAAREPVARPRQYRVQSATRATLAPELGPYDRRRALYLPEGFDPRARELAARWRAQGGDEAVVRAALDLFHADFTYTLNPPLLGRDSIDDFLFDTRRGYCEHYAAAFVFLMRAAGIPARIVTGYQGGWWNGTYLLVRQSDAHAWAEVWLAGQGWRRVDPTAAVSPARIELGAHAADDSVGWSRADWLRDLRNRLDVANRLWTEAIVRFDAVRQRGLLTPFGVASANPGDLMLALSAVLGLAMLAATIWAMRAAPAAAGDALDRAWAALRRRLQRAGFAAPAHEGPNDLLQRLHAASPAAAQRLQPVVTEYVDLRYRSAMPDARRVRALHAAIGRLRLRNLVKTPR